MLVEYPFHVRTHHNWWVNSEQLFNSPQCVPQVNHILIVSGLINQPGSVCNKSKLIHIVANLFQLAGHSKIISRRGFSRFITNDNLTNISRLCKPTRLSSSSNPLVLFLTQSQTELFRSTGVDMNISFLSRDSAALKPPGLSSIGS